MGFISVSIQVAQWGMLVLNLKETKFPPEVGEVIVLLKWASAACILLALEIPSAEWCLGPLQCVR